MRIIGITGTIGAGKGTVVDHLVKRHGFLCYSARSFIIEEIERRGLSVNRDTMVDVGNDLRRVHGAGYIIGDLYERALAGGRDAVIESIRTPGELENLRRNPDFYLFALDAEPRVRYERIRQRGSVTDHVSFEKFLSDEAREMHSDDPTKQNIAAVMAQADYRFDNIESAEDLTARVDEVLKEIDRRRAERA